MKLEEIFEEENFREERAERVRQLEDEITAPMLAPDAPLADYRQFREFRNRLSSGPQCGPGEFNYQECRLAKEMAEENNVPWTLTEYRQVIQEREEYRKNNR